MWLGTLGPTFSAIRHLTVNQAGDAPRSRKKPCRVLSPRALLAGLSACTNLACLELCGDKDFWPVPEGLAPHPAQLALWLPHVTKLSLSLTDDLSFALIEGLGASLQQLHVGYRLLTVPKHVKLSKALLHCKQLQRLVCPPGWALGHLVLAALMQLPELTHVEAELNSQHGGWGRPCLGNSSRCCLPNHVPPFSALGWHQAGTSGVSTVY